MTPTRYLRPGLPFPDGAVRCTYARSGGPGGQNVNKVETKVIARLALADVPGLTASDLDRVRRVLGSRLTDDEELVVHASSTRFRERNREEAFNRLCALLSGALRRPKKRRPTRPTRGSKERRLGAKKRRGDVKRLRQRPDRE